MGAIAGVLGQKLLPQEISKILVSMKGRSLGETRIQEIESGTLFCAEDQRKRENSSTGEISLAGEKYSLVFCGHIYNLPTIRKELQQQGYVLKDAAVEEILISAYVQWGQDFLKKLRGGFTVGIWEHRRKRLLLGRDQMGIQPLFYKKTNGGLIFGSDLRTVLAAPGVRALLDKEGAMELVMLGPGRLPGSGVLKDIQELEPGCLAVFEEGTFTVRRYWQLLDREHRDSFEETAEKVRFLVESSTRQQLEGLSQVGAFLSGGLDSSILTAICAREHPDEKIRTFSVDYQDNDVNFRPGAFEPDSDGKYIRMMVEAFGCSHENVVLTPDDLTAQLEEATRARGLPGMGDVDFSLLAFCKKVKQQVPVVFSGECADEIFGGYPWYRDKTIRERDGFPWAQNTGTRSSLLNFTATNAEDFVMEAYQNTCRSADVLPGATPENRRIKELVNLNMRWFMQTLVSRNDAMSSASGLEVRVPFCNVDIAEYLYCVPWDMKDYQGREKGLLRYAVKGLLPEAVRMRKKSPYPKTFDPKYEALVAARLRSVMAQDAPIWHMIRKDTAAQLLTQEAPAPWYGQLMRRPQFIAWLLQLDFWLRDQQIELLF